MIIYNKPSQKELSQRKLENFHRYCKLITWGRREPVAFTSRIMGIELLDIQKYAIYSSWTRDFVLWLESRNAGKALALDTVIPTPSGNKTMGDLKVGDYVFDEQGNPTKVTYTSEIFLGHKCYEITFSDGEKIIADEDHLWYVQTKEDQYFKVVPTKDMAHDYIVKSESNKKKKYNYKVPNYLDKKNKTKSITSVKEVPTVPTKCIEVDSSNKLYLCGKKNTVTHNTTKLAIYPMIRSLLIPYHVTYYIGNSGE